MIDAVVGVEGCRGLDITPAMCREEVEDDLLVLFDRHVDLSFVAAARPSANLASRHSSAAFKPFSFALV